MTRVRMSRAEAVDRVCRVLRADGERATPDIARAAGIARSVAYSICAELTESGELARRQDGHVWLYRLVWQDVGQLRPVVRLCREHAIEVERVRWRDQARIRAADPRPGCDGFVWLDTTEDVVAYLADRGVRELASVSGGGSTR